MNLYVGNLSYNLHEDQLVKVFEQYGAVKSVRLVTDRETGRPRGFGFVEMADREGGQGAIDNLDGYDLEGRKLVVNEARPKPARR